MTAFACHLHAQTDRPERTQVILRLDEAHGADDLMRAVKCGRVDVLVKDAQACDGRI